MNCNTQGSCLFFFFPLSLVLLCWRARRPAGLESLCSCDACSWQLVFTCLGDLRRVCTTLSIQRVCKALNRSLCFRTPINTFHQDVCLWKCHYYTISKFLSRCLWQCLNFKLAFAILTNNTLETLIFKR